MPDRKLILDYGMETSPNIRILEGVAIFLSLCVGLTMVVLFVWAVLVCFLPTAKM